MKVTKLKKINKNEYLVYFDNGKNLKLYEDVIINYKLLTDKEIDFNLLKKIRNDNNEKEAYNIALNYINYRMRSIQETKDQLLKKGISNEIIEEVVSTLIKQGYLNDQKFTIAFINTKKNTSNWGPLKVIGELKKLGIKMSLVNQHMYLYDNELDKISLLVNKKLKTNKDSKLLFKKKVMNNLLGLGFNRDNIIKILDKVNIKENLESLEKEHNKLYNKYQNKYEGDNLIYQIKIRLLKKGFNVDNIEEIINKKGD